ncbi:aminoacyl-tRNA deacylase [Solicola gregarius]|uniref:YbaK/EbsC family protein n=1 Tax=Solicola gregarius TaxID=2908642 RepID=A0AA46TNJ9_9ACTN|nr:YbaK/EbsC family protein [Solicola gregarius]UYM07658.1 YbaK/EbsC family protein [Solicola gregarius]
MDGTARARADARECGLAIEVRERPQARSLEEAAAALGVEPLQVVKTLVIRRGAGDYVLALVPGDRTLSWPRLRAAAGANRMSLPDADEARAATGYERGTITPIGCHHPWPVFVDASISGRVAIGSGSHRHSIVVDAADLVAAYDATVVPLTG